MGERWDQPGASLWGRLCTELESISPLLIYSVMNQWGDSNTPRNAACVPAGGTHFSLSSVCVPRERQTGNFTVEKSTRYHFTFRSGLRERKTGHVAVKKSTGYHFTFSQAWGHSHWQQVPHATMWKIVSPHYLFFPKFTTLSTDENELQTKEYPLKTSD